MSLQFGTIDSDSRFGITLSHSFIRQENGSDKLLVLLPGGGYTNDYPLMYYLRKAGLQLGYDVLSVQYGSQVTGANLDAETISYIQADSEAAVKAAMVEGYQQVCFAGKSLGTPLAAGFAKMMADISVSLILLTPIGGATQGLGDIPTVAISGTADPMFVAELATDTPHLKWMICEGLNHSLEHKNDWRGSLEVLPEIIAACETFLRNQST